MFDGPSQRLQGHNSISIKPERYNRKLFEFILNQHVQDEDLSLESAKREVWVLTFDEYNYYACCV
jgi:hypothetical protein